MDILILSEAADSNMIIVQKGSSVLNRRDTIVSFAEAKDIILEDMDVVIIPPKMNYPKKIETVSISGAVARPGPYTCIDNVTNAQDIINICGGYTSQANPERAYIIRRNIELKNVSKDVTTPDIMALSDKKAVYNVGSVRPGLNFAFSRLNSFQDCSIISLKEQGFSTLVEQDDMIVIPFKEYFIYVSGSVHKPGAYPYIEGKNIRYYINQAGGFTKKSDRRNTYVLTRYSTSLQFKDGKNIEEGDIIVVPDSQRNQLMLDIVLPVLQIVSTLTTVVFSIFVMSKTE
jgi:protein involved in polysaccharide export with SLBB domain